MGPLALAAAAGTLADAILLLDTWAWISLTFVSFMIHLIPGWSRRQTLLLVATGTLFGAWHAERTRLVPSDDIGQFAHSTPLLCRVEGILNGQAVVDYPTPKEASLQSRSDPRTQFILNVERLESGRGTETATGSISVFIAGECRGLESGDRLDIVGWLSRPRGPANRGEFDYRAYAESRGRRATLFGEGEQCLTRLETGSSWNWARLRDSLRSSAGMMLREHLTPEAARTAEAFLLGVRNSMPQEEIVPYIECGTIHLLVVSGLHVSLIASLFWNLAGWLFFPPSWRSLTTMAVVIFYMLLTGANPPAVRAAVFAILLLGGHIVGRRADGLNTLCAAAIVILTLDPNDIFRPGPQLSFLCAFALLVIVPIFRVTEHDPLTPRGPWESSWHWLKVKSFDLLLTSVIVWIVATPLLVHSFHLLTPVAVVASLPLIPISFIGLILGLAYLLGLAFVPIIGPTLGIALEGVMNAMSMGSSWGATWEWGSRYMSGLPLTWTIAFYALFVIPWLLPVIHPTGRLHIASLFLCLLVGGIVGMLPSYPQHDEYHQLAVGHGNAGVLRPAGGGTILFDVGSITGPKASEKIVAPWLWHEGIDRIEAVILSHADIDHFNGLAVLARRFAVDKVFVPSNFLTSKEPAATFILEELRERSIPVLTLAEGDTLRLGKCLVRVLQPPDHFQGEDDNAGSLVSLISASSGTLLSTGDVSGSGQEILLQKEVEPIDVLIAPHHGAAGSNTPLLAQWAHPRVVISSQGHEKRSTDPLRHYDNGRTLILRTNDVGEIKVRWHSGSIEVESFSPQRQWPVSDR